jgi:hypothetical protein
MPQRMSVGCANRWKPTCLADTAIAKIDLIGLCDTRIRPETIRHGFAAHCPISEDMMLCRAT